MSSFPRCICESNPTDVGKVASGDQFIFWYFQPVNDQCNSSKINNNNNNNDKLYLYSTFQKQVYEVLYKTIIAHINYTAVRIEINNESKCQENK